MLAVHVFRQHSSRLTFNTSRLTFSNLSHPKISEHQSAEKNVPGFYNTSNSDRVDLSTTQEKIESNEVTPPNDLLEAKRYQEEHQKNKSPITIHATTNTEKFVVGLHPLPVTSSITPASTGLFQNVPISNTPLAPGIPIVTNRPLAVHEEIGKKEEPIRVVHPKSILQSLRSIWPFSSSSSSSSSSIDFATTREHFLPITRPSLIRLLATNSQFVDRDNDRLLFHQLCQGFDSAVAQRYQSILNELKHLFNPLNPDDETIENRRVPYRDRLDNEYWLLQKIDHLLHRANFTELSRDLLLNKFILHEDSLSSTNLQVRINGYDYDVLKFWILGREQSLPIEQPWWKRILRRRSSTVSTDYFKRVVLAVRLKGQDRLYLKAFRDIPLQNLTQLVPLGKLQIGSLEKKVFNFSAILAVTTLGTYLLSIMANYHIPGLLVGGTSLAAVAGLWSLRSFYQSKINYLSNMNRVLFYKNVASNKQLLAMIVDRAQDELSKEVLLVYMFILWKQKQNVNLTAKNLELDIENWVRWTTNSNITFNSDQSLEFLRQLGILLPDSQHQPGCLRVLPLNEVVGILPKISRTLGEKSEEWDLIEGYDKKYFELDWKTVLNEDQLLNKSRWS